MHKRKDLIDMAKFQFTDTHAHILPRMDDGSRNCEESVEMLKMLRQQGVSAVVASSHFYPENEDPGSFVERRETAMAELYNEMMKSTEALPCIYAGAEVAYFDGISTSDSIGSLCILGTELLLVELPFRRWGHTVVQEICDLIDKRGITPIIAHVERYFPYCRDSMIRYLAQKGAVIQINASALTTAKTKRRTLRLLKQGVITLIGTDCHNTDTRAPNINLAIEEIGKKLGEEKLKEISKKGVELFLDAVAFSNTADKDQL